MTYEDPVWVKLSRMTSTGRIATCEDARLGPGLLEEARDSVGVGGRVVDRLHHHQTVALSSCVKLSSRAKFRDRVKRSSCVKL